MLIESTGLALIAALSPTALLVTAVYLGSARPKLVTTFYLIGATAMSLVMATVLLVVLRDLDLSRADHHAPRYALRLGSGVVMLVAAIVVSRRRTGGVRAPHRHGVVARMVADPSPTTALVVGVLVFAPGATFLASIQVIATAQAGLELTVTALLIVVVVNVLLVWLPIVLYVFVRPARQRTWRASTAGYKRTVDRCWHGHSASSVRCWPPTGSTASFSADRCLEAAAVPTPTVARLNLGMSRQSETELAGRRLAAMTPGLVDLSGERLVDALLAHVVAELGVDTAVVLVVEQSKSQLVAFASRVVSKRRSCRAFISPSGWDSLDATRRPERRSCSMSSNLGRSSIP